MPSPLETTWTYDTADKILYVDIMVRCPNNQESMGSCGGKANVLRLVAAKHGVIEGTFCRVESRIEEIDMLVCPNCRIMFALLLKDWSVLRGQALEQLEWINQREEAEKVSL